jgi:hypothetical protein
MLFLYYNLFIYYPGSNHFLCISKPKEEGQHHHFIIPPIGQEFINGIVLSSLKDYQFSISNSSNSNIIQQTQFYELNSDNKHDLNDINIINHK